MRWGSAEYEISSFASRATIYFLIAIHFLSKLPVYFQQKNTLFFQMKAVLVRDT